LGTLRNAAWWLTSSIPSSASSSALSSRKSFSIKRILSP